MQNSDRKFLLGQTPGPYLSDDPEHKPQISKQLFSIIGMGGISRWRGTYTEEGVPKHTSYEFNFTGVARTALEASSAQPFPFGNEQIVYRMAP